MAEELVKAGVEERRLAVDNMKVRAFQQFP